MDINRDLVEVHIRIGKQVCGAADAHLIDKLLKRDACFLAEELHHDCAGEDCPVCACLQLCENQVRRAGAGSACTSVFYVLAVFVFVQQAFNLFLPVLTPITRKVRLDR